MIDSVCWKLKKKIFWERINNKATEREMGAIKGVLAYDKGTTDVGLFYARDSSQWVVRVLSDSDHCSEADRLTRCAFIEMMGSHCISWQSKSHTDISLSSCESELYSGNYSGMEAIFLSKLQWEFISRRVLTVHSILLVPHVYIDNKATVKVVYTGGFTSKLKHVDIRCQWLISQVRNKRIMIHWIKGVDNASDMGTKPLGKVILYTLMNDVGLRRIRLEGNAQVIFGVGRDR